LRSSCNCRARPQLSQPEAEGDDEVQRDGNGRQFLSTPICSHSAHLYKRIQEKQRLRSRNPRIRP
jgi:hypothetical protein